MLPKAKNATTTTRSARRVNHPSRKCSPSFACGSSKYMSRNRFQTQIVTPSGCTLVLVHDPFVQIKNSAGTASLGVFKVAAAGADISACVVDQPIKSAYWSNRMHLLRVVIYYTPSVYTAIHGFAVDWPTGDRSKNCASHGQENLCDIRLRVLSGVLILSILLASIQRLLFFPNGSGDELTY
jgi:hypothetical protein